MAPVSPHEERTLRGVFAPTLTALVPAVPFVLLPLLGGVGTLNLLLALLLAGVVSVCTALCLAAAATDAPAGVHPAGAILQRSLGRGVGAAVALPITLARPLLAALAVVTGRHLFGALTGITADGWGWAVDLGLLGGLGIVGVIGGARAWIPLARPYALGVLAVGVLATASAALFAPLDPRWIPGSGTSPIPAIPAATVDISWALALAVPALLSPPGGADGTARLAEPRRSYPAGTLWAVAVAAALALLVIVDPVTFATVGSTGLGAVGWAGLLLALGWMGLTSLRGAVASLEEALAEGWLPAREHAPTWLPVVGAFGVAALAALLGSPIQVAWALSVVLLLASLGIQLAVLLPLWLHLPSFRPTVRLSLAVPGIGLVAAGLTLAILAPATGVLGLVLMGALYVRAERTAEDADRSALLPALLTRATATDVAQEAPRAWTPRIIVPLAQASLDPAHRAFLVQAVLPEGALHLLGITPTEDDAPALETGLTELVGDLRAAEGVAASRSVLTSASWLDGATAALQVLQGTFPAPGLVYVQEAHPDLDRLVSVARRARAGVLWHLPHPERPLGDRRAVNLWVRPPELEGWQAQASFALGHVDLALLTCLRLQRNLGMRVTLVAAVTDADDLPRAHAFLDELARLGRMPENATRTVALVGSLPSVLGQAPPADLHVLGLPPSFAPDFAERLREHAGASVLLVGGSGRESATV